jgi:nitrogen regulatory protein P-II 1
MGDYKAIFAILQKGIADGVMEAAKKAGAPGGTIFLARGTGANEAKTFFGITLETAREVLIIVTEESQADKILQTVTKAGNLTKPGAGIAFSMSIDDIVGFTPRNNND